MWGEITIEQVGHSALVHVRMVPRIQIIRLRAPPDRHQIGPEGNPTETRNGVTTHDGVNPIDRTINNGFLIPVHVHKSRRKADSSEVLKSSCKRPP